MVVLVGIDTPHVLFKIFKIWSKRGHKNAKNAFFLMYLKTHLIFRFPMVILEESDTPNVNEKKFEKNCVDFLELGPDKTPLQQKLLGVAEKFFLHNNQN